MPCVARPWPCSARKVFQERWLPGAPLPEEPPLSRGSRSWVLGEAWKHKRLKMPLEEKASASSQPRNGRLSRRQQRHNRLREETGGTGQSRDRATVSRQRPPSHASSSSSSSSSRECHRQVQRAPEESSVQGSQSQDLSGREDKAPRLSCSWSSLSSMSSLGAWSHTQQADSDTKATLSMPSGSSRLSCYSISSDTSFLPELTRKPRPREPPAPPALPGAGTVRLPPIAPTPSSAGSRTSVETRSGSTSSGKTPEERSSSRRLAPHGLDRATGAARRAASRGVEREVPGSVSAPALSSPRGSTGAAAAVSSPGRDVASGQQRQGRAAGLQPVAPLVRVRCRLLSGTGQPLQEEEQPAGRRRTLLSIQRKPRPGEEPKSSSAAGRGRRLSPLRTRVTLQRQHDGLQHSQLHRGLAQKPLGPILTVKYEGLGQKEETCKEDTTGKEEVVLEGLEGSSNNQAGATQEDSSNTVPAEDTVVYKWINPLFQEDRQDHGPATVPQEEPSSGSSMPDPEVAAGELQVHSRSPTPVELREALPLTSTMDRAHEDAVERQAPAPVSPAASQDILLEGENFVLRSMLSVLAVLMITKNQEEQALVAALQDSESQCPLAEETHAAPPALAAEEQDKDACMSPVLGEQVSTVEEEEEEECHDPSPCSPTASQDAFLASNQAIVEDITGQAVVTSQEAPAQNSQDEAAQAPAAAPQHTESSLAEVAEVAPSRAAMPPADTGRAQLGPAKQRRPSIFRRAVRALRRAFRALSCVAAEIDG